MNFDERQIRRREHLRADERAEEQLVIRNRNREKMQERRNAMDEEEGTSLCKHEQPKLLLISCVL